MVSNRITKYGHRPQAESRLALAPPTVANVACLLGVSGTPESITMAIHQLAFSQAIAEVSARHTDSLLRRFQSN